TPTAGRNQAETEAMIGFFVNTLVLRTDLSGEPTFRELLRREREVALEAYLNQEVPFEKVVEELEVERDMSRTPLFQVMMTLQNRGPESAKVRGLAMIAVKKESGTAHYEMSLMMRESEAGRRGIME